MKLKNCFFFLEYSWLKFGILAMRRRYSYVTPTDGPSDVGPINFLSDRNVLTSSPSQILASSIYQDFRKNGLSALTSRRHGQGTIHPIVQCAR